VIDLGSLHALAPLGVGGLLAGMMFFFYRQDFLRERLSTQVERERLEHREDRLLQIIEKNAGAYERLAVTLEHMSGPPAGRER
jgi:hypothetical protein